MAPPTLYQRTADDMPDHDFDDHDTTFLTVLGITAAFVLIGLLAFFLKKMLECTEIMAHNPQPVTPPSHTPPAWFDDFSGFGIKPLVGGVVVWLRERLVRRYRRRYSDNESIRSMRTATLPFISQPVGSRTSNSQSTNNPLSPPPPAHASTHRLRDFVMSRGGENTVAS